MSAPAKPASAKAPAAGGKGHKLIETFFNAAMFVAAPIVAHRAVAQYIEMSGNEAGAVGAIIGGTAVMAAFGVKRLIEGKPLKALAYGAFAAAVHVGGLAGAQDARLTDWRGSCLDKGAEMVGIDVYNQPNDPVPACNIYDLKPQPR